jgi:hypothetical protein
VGKSKAVPKVKKIVPVPVPEPLRQRVDLMNMINNHLQDFSDSQLNAFGFDVNAINQFRENLVND